MPEKKGKKNIYTDIEKVAEDSKGNVGGMAHEWGTHKLKPHNGLRF